VPPLAAAGPAGTIVFPLVLLAYWIPYHRRCRTLAAQGRPVEPWRRRSFVAGLLFLAVAFSPPVGKLADQLFLAHMAEHLLISDFAGLLLVLGLTGPVLAPLLRNPVIDRLRVLTHPVVALVLWTVNLYAWHTPTLYQAALRHDGIHVLEHATFLFFAMAVWMALLGPFPKPAWFRSAGAQLGYIIAVRLIGTVLANVFLWSGHLFYPFYLPGTAKWHIAPLADQSTAGAVMMVEESILTIGLFCWLFLKAARQADERQELLDYARQHGLELEEDRAARAVTAGRGPELRARLEERAGEGEPADPVRAT
jgi:cytochrome c oxidase assembly factor CtaG